MNNPELSWKALFFLLVDRMPWLMTGKGLPTEFSAVGLSMFLFGEVTEENGEH